MKLPRPYIPLAPPTHQATNPASQARFGIQDAAAKGQTEKLVALLQHYPRRATDALYWAAGNGHHETVAALVRTGARPTMKAIEAARSNDHQTIVRMMERRIAESLRGPVIEI